VLSIVLSPIGGGLPFAHPSGRWIMHAIHGAKARGPRFQLADDILMPCRMPAESLREHRQSRRRIPKACLTLSGLARVKQTCQKGLKESIPSE
jgi:hypothetical protein